MPSALLLSKDRGLIPAVQTSLVQCEESTKHEGGRKISYWSAIRRRDS
jgi:hypothetical protein